MTLLVGMFELVLGFARMGALVNFISHSVVVGFTAGAAVLIAAKQLNYFFGVEIDRGGHLHAILIQVLNEVSQTDPNVTGISLFTLATGVAVRLWIPRLPYMIVAMVGGSLLEYRINSLYGPAHTILSRE